MFSNFFGEADPLGLGVKGRAREKRLAASMAGTQTIGGPLPDPNWDGYFQAADEVNEGGPGVKFAGGNMGGQQVQGRSAQPSLLGLQSALKPRRTR
jgi:hypothetical protein